MEGANSTRLMTWRFRLGSSDTRRALRAQPGALAEVLPRRARMAGNRPGFGGAAAAFSSGRTHHELLLIEVGEDATPIPQGRRVGMYHFGLKVGETDDELREAIAAARRTA